MIDSVEFLTRGVLIGIGAAVLMDAWALFARRAFDIRGLDYALLGRWIGHFPRRRFFHERIASADRIAASKTPDPRAARLRNLATHTVYGIGLSSPP